ncbi:MAG: AAA family ATPase, partial [Clostridia bacterium]|nr:AAA family ATPase [Clostridia bacterium]
MNDKNGIKITAFEAENIKRIVAVQLAPHETGLTVIGGDNGHGKTSVLDAIAWGLGGDRFKPGAAVRDGAETPPVLRVKLSNGLVVERKGKNSDLKVTDPDGQKHGQELLNELIGVFALNLPKFMQASDREKASVLLRIIGVEERLADLEKQEKAMYDERTVIGREADAKRKYADTLPFYADVPEDVISISDLILKQQEILAKNGENARKRQNLQNITARKQMLAQQVAALQEQLAYAQTQLVQVTEEELIASVDAGTWVDVSTAEIERSIAEIEQTNERVRNNLNRRFAYEDANEAQSRYDDLTLRIEGVRSAKRALLKEADLPLAGLSVENGCLLFNQKPWDCMSGSEQLRVATAIVRRLNPNCGFVLIDKLEQMDLQTLREFGAWLESEGLQAIATRVSKGDECSIIITDGVSRAVSEETPTFGSWEERL